MFSLTFPISGESVLVTYCRVSVGPVRDRLSFSTRLDIPRQYMSISKYALRHFIIT